MTEDTTFPPLVDRVIVITGPTASGKSRTAVELAERIGGEILSLDSIAVYRDMDIGTAKPELADRRRVPHHLLDLVTPSEEFSVARYLAAAHERTADLQARGRPAIFAGGTPLFLKALLRGFDPGPPADWDFRKSVEADIQRFGIDALYERLRQVDPLAAHRIDRGDKRRMIRALEVARTTGQPMSHRQTQFEQTRDAEDCLVFSLRHDRPRLHQRINARVSEMFQRGLVDEVRGLIHKYGGLSRTARQAVGYREVIDWLESGGNLDEIREAVAAHTRQLARRQETWFRSFGEVRFIDVGETMTVDSIATRIAEIVEQTSSSATSRVRGGTYSEAYGRVGNRRSGV